ncbi:transcription repressor NadR [Lacticaseibacillus kribbianus]|uniref:transcription repressor NadR n=1 Tax=Lacticaseibacillus kribbianus TaxID=2926292 RepID=UPI001CD7905F|nr:transcription repressor NadR [Lacticaseibacillus kribbianus]
MLTSAERQAQIRSALADNNAPITATQFGQRFGVSRQTVVGDIALMRARGEGIIATPQGYQYEEKSRHEAVIVCRHTPEQAREEMNTVVDLGGTMIDVLVEHPVYGQMRGQLQVKTRTDVNLFMGHLRQREGHLLSELTDGVHLHTIGYDTPEQLTAIKDALRAKGFLFEEVG